MADHVDQGNRYAQQMIDQAIANRTRYRGTSRTHCADCEEPIPPGRRQAVPGCTRCVECEELAGRRRAASATDKPYWSKP